MKYQFLHIPKTGGTTIMSYLKNHENVDIFIHRILKHEKNLNNDRLKFTFIRDPIKRTISSYTYATKIIEKLKKNKKLDTFQEGNWKKLYELFKKYNIIDIHSYVSNLPILFENEIKAEYYRLEKIDPKKIYYYYKVLFFPQNWFFCDDNKNILVDKIYTTNNINKVMKEMFDIDVTKRLNTSKSNLTLTKKEEEIIISVYKEDYDILGKYL